MSMSHIGVSSASMAAGVGASVRSKFFSLPLSYHGHTNGAPSAAAVAAAAAAAAATNYDGAATTPTHASEVDESDVSEVEVR
jgi:adenosylmethionine-8-amino-7-oxononanoate aminotransferase